MAVKLAAVSYRLAPATRRTSGVYVFKVVWTALLTAAVPPRTKIVAGFSLVSSAAIWVGIESGRTSSSGPPFLVAAAPPARASGKFSPVAM